MVTLFCAIVSAASFFLYNIRLENSLLLTFIELHIFWNTITISKVQKLWNKKTIIILWINNRKMPSKILNSITKKLRFLYILKEMNKSNPRSAVYKLYLKLKFAHIFFVSSCFFTKLKTFGWLSIKFLTPYRFES